MLKTWNQVRRHFWIMNKFSVSVPIVCYPEILVSKHRGIRLFLKYNISFYGGTPKSFSQLRTEFDLPQAQVFWYLQFRSYIHSIPT